MFGRNAFRVGVTACLAVLVGVVAWGSLAPGQGGTEKPKKKKKTELVTDDREADRKAIRQATDSFLKALESGDVKAIAAHWTAEGELMDDEGTTLRGRAAIEKAYAEDFAKNPRTKAEVNVESLRFLGSDTAIEEGYFKVTKGKAGETTTNRYSVLLVRENGKWQMAVVREFADEGNSLREIDWLIGTWEAKNGDTTIRTTHEWDENRSFIKARFTIKDKDRTQNVTQMIGRDASTGLLRSWTFESQGGFGAAVWSRDGKKWVLESTGVTPAGSTMTATNIITPLGPDAFLWQSTERTLDGDDLPATPPIRVQRVKSTK